MPTIQSAFFLKLPHFMVPREIEVQDNFKAIERWANRLTLPDTEVPVPANGGGLSATGSPPSWSVNVDGTSIVIVGNALRVNTNGISLANMASNSVGSDEIINGSITSSELGVGAVDTANIQADAVTATELATNSVTSDAIAPGAVGTSEILDASITSSDIGLNQITTGLIANSAVTFAKTATDWPRFHCSKGSGQSIGPGNTPITFTGETYDIGNWHSSGSSSFFVPDNAAYNFSGYCEFNPEIADNEFAGAEILMNGIRIGYAGCNTEWSERPAATVSVSIHGAVGAQIQLRGVTGISAVLASAAFSGCAIANN